VGPGWYLRRVTAPERHGPGLELRELFPEHRTVGVEELMASLNLVGAGSAERPYTVVNFVASADGRAAFKGRSGALGDKADKAVFHGLRERVDAVFAGTGTMRLERYGRLVRDPERRRRRAAAGLRPEPLACVITRSGDVPTGIPLFSEPESRIVMFTPTPIDLSHCSATVDVVRLDPGQLTLTTMMRRLRSDYDVRALLCEGGPTVFGALLQEGLVDELFLTLAPKLAGGGAAPTISSGPELAELALLELVWALEQAGSLFLRYALRSART
jgi:riboflavin-specific deaminase-like protein